MPLVLILKMGDLFDFQRGQIVGARIAGATIIETAQLLEISRDTVSKRVKLILQSINLVAVLVCLKRTEEH